VGSSERITLTPPPLDPGGGLGFGGRRPGRGGPPERHVAQPQAPGPLCGVLLLPPVLVAVAVAPLLLLWRNQQRLAVRVGRRGTYGRGRALLGEERKSERWRRQPAPAGQSAGAYRTVRRGSTLQPNKK
jgi:hypothetical protein